MISEELALQYACNLVAHYRDLKSEYYARIKAEEVDWEKLPMEEWPSAIRLAWKDFMSARARAGDWIEVLVGDRADIYGTVLRVRDQAEDPEMALLEILTS